MKAKRRHFLKQMAAATAAPMVLNGLPINLFARESKLQALAENACSDRILIVLQLHGGNDGLNTIIPINQYGEYQFNRPGIAIPDSGKRSFINLDKSLPIDRQVGLHPDMIAAKALYEEGKMAIVHNVSYENANGSHFRGRDVWFMGGGYNDSFGSGWMGRYLDERYPDYPDKYPSSDMPDPPAIEIGNGVSLAFHRDNGIPIALGLQNPEQFYDLINSTGGTLPVSFENNHYGDELKYIMEIEKQSNQYAGRLRDVFNSGSNAANAAYPEKYPFLADGKDDNGLSRQLKLIARLIKGGINTKIFLARIGGFDTHANQVIASDPTMGQHAALLYHMSESVKAFQDDLKELGLDDRVITVTFSEFGRRVFSNGSFGTDHGDAAPMFVFGKAVEPGSFGSPPKLGQNDIKNGNVPMEHDYRRVLASIMQDWLCVDDKTLELTEFDEFVKNKVNVINTNKLGFESQNTFKQVDILNPVRPNPVKESFTASFFLRTKSETLIQIIAPDGKEVYRKSRVFSRGSHELNIQHKSNSLGVHHLIMTVQGKSYLRKFTVVD